MAREALELVTMLRTLKRKKEVTKEEIFVLLEEVILYLDRKFDDPIECMDK